MQQMTLILREDDFKAHIESSVPTRSSPLGREIGDPSAGEPAGLRQAVMDALPKVLARRIEAIWNVVEGFELTAFEVKVGIEGKPFGVGIDGEASLHFERTRQGMAAVDSGAGSSKPRGALTSSA